MHLSDVLVIGPISPRGSRVLRVRIGALLIAGLLAIVAAAGGCAVLVLRPDWHQWSDGLPHIFAGNGPGTARAQSSDDRTVEMDSNPAGATVQIDGHDYGRTPVVVSAPPGKTVILHREGFLDAFVIPAEGSVSIQLWRSRPEVRTVRPPTPGALITSADSAPCVHRA